MSEIHEAHAALVAEGIDNDTALRCLSVLTEAGFLVTRPQHLLDTVVSAAVALDIVRSTT